MSTVDDKFEPVTREDIDSIAALRRRLDFAMEQIRTEIHMLSSLVRQSLDNHQRHSEDDKDRFNNLERRVTALESEAGNHVRVAR